MTPCDPGSTWVLTDRYGSQYADHVFSAVAIRSADHLRAVLAEFAGRDPRLLDLDSPDGFRVGLALGGPHGAVEVYGREGGHEYTLVALADGPTTADAVCFVNEWQPYRVPPCNLLPAGEVIALAAELYETRRVPRRVRWERW